MTDTPWRTCHATDDDAIGITRGEGVVFLAEVYGPMRRERAALIVSAVNERDGLIEALQAAEHAHQVHAKCDDCIETASDPASCEHCVKSWDKAYELRQAALSGLPPRPRSAFNTKDLRDRLTRAKHQLEDVDLFGDSERINRAVGEIVGALAALEKANG